MEEMNCDWMASDDGPEFDNPTSSTSHQSHIREDHDLEQERLPVEKQGARAAQAIPADISNDPPAGWLDRPIVVGYAFGPKKMSTMGVVMAEASKAKLTAAAAASATSPSRLTFASSGDTQSNRIDAYTARTPHSVSVGASTSHSQDDCLGPAHTDDIGSTFPVPQSRHPSISGSNLMMLEDSINSAMEPVQSSPQQEQSFVFTMDLLNGKEHNGSGGLQNIVRHFRSSCSSVGSVSTAVTANSTLTSKTRASARSFASVSTKQHTKKERQQEDDDQRIPIRVAFVPLDPDIPLEDQHGGKMDVILHKLTEDILCLSQLEQANRSNDPRAISVEPDELQKAAISRVRRLTDFQREHPECSVVDSPDFVQTLMSRADIANRLRTCLQNVRTVSGIPVGSPEYAVISRPHSPMSLAEIEHQVAHLRFPMILKPLVAAGAKASHAMTVLMDPSALATVADKAPCLCQEYSNHDAALHKVYVLGDYVSVHKRRSLPNLPRNQPSRRGFVEFDSQRPYPRLIDFGYDKNGRHQTTGSPGSVAGNGKPISVTIEEVKPIVTALKEAFGLELFGFDILVVSADNSRNHHHQMLVVDVNYFPSYKEVTNFPTLLAKYLTDRAVANRRRATAVSVLRDTSDAKTTAIPEDPLVE